MRSIVIAAAALALASPGYAGTLATSFVLQAPGQHVHCDVVNVGASSVTVKADLTGLNGSVAVSHSASLGPGQGFGVVGQCINPGGTPPGCSGYCRFTAAHKNQIRGVLTVTPSDSDSPVVSLAAQ